MRKIITLILAFALALSLCACGTSQTGSPSPQETDKTSGNDSFAGKYTGVGLYTGEQIALDEYFDTWTTTLNADGSGDIIWDETSGPISKWSVENGKLSIQAGVSDIQGILSDGLMLLELDGGYVVAFVREGYDLSKLHTISMEEYLNSTDSAGTYIPFAIGKNGYCLAIPDSGDGDGNLVLSADGTAVITTGGVENSFTWALEGTAITLTDEAGDSMTGTLENAIMILNVPTAQEDGSTVLMQGYYALEGADHSAVPVMTAEEYQAAIASAGTSGAENPAVAVLEQRYNDLTEDSLSWSFDESTKTLTISGKGAMRDYSKAEPGWYSFCETAEHIVIGDEVTSVGRSAFWDFMTITDVSLGASVEYIGDFAFYYCWELRNVNFPAGLKYIGEGGFYNTLLHSDSGFVFPEEMLYLGDGAFHSACKESFVSIPASLTFIGENAFANGFVEEFRVSSENPAYTSDNGILYDKNMTTLITYPSGKTDTVYEIPGTVTTVLDEAVEVSNTLTEIRIPSSVTYIDEGAFFWNYALTSVTVDENNPNYKSVDGVLFTKDGKTLLCYPIASSGTEYAVPDGCERIGFAALSQADHLTAIHLPEGVREIAQWGLYNCKSLSLLDLPKSLKTIETQAILACDVLGEVRYAGSGTDWQEISIAEGNELLTDGSVSVKCAQ